ncbi:hypothetical protein AAVH_28492 [Aphelenchoides avenae]|nr:hypothetical protein AAVH_28492 [Aphelenchus avenae]
MENLLARVKLLEVYSLAQMVFIKYIDRRRSNDVDRTPAALEFLHEVLIARNSRRELPVLIKRYQPQITDHDTTDPWPTRKDLRNALDNWSCYCAHAAIYVIKHLSGPIVFEPDWLAIEDLSPAFFQRVLNALRHQMYRQYVHAFMEAIKVGLEGLSYKRFDDDKKKRMPLGTLTALPAVLFADQYILDTFGPDLRDDVQPILIDMADRDGVIEQVLHYYPHSTTTRVVFWFSSDYIRVGNKGLRFILAALGYHYTVHLGCIEQVVVLPTHDRHKREIWTRSVLSSCFQRKNVMPFARVALGLLDLRV